MARLSPVEFHVLVALASGAKHGYAILTDVRERSAEPFLPGSLYRVLARLLDQDLIEELDERPDPELDDERRRYYKATAAGLAAARDEARRLESLLEGARAAKLLPKKRRG